MPQTPPKAGQSVPSYIQATAFAATDKAQAGVNWNRWLNQIQYVSDETGQPVSVIVPIELWREIESERETAYLLRSSKMKERLLRAMSSEEGIPFEEALEKLGIRP
jgi:hypothetical protein